MNDTTPLTGTASSRNNKPTTAPKADNTMLKTKKQTAIQLLRRAQGASLTELQKRLDWQPHSVRGFLSGTARKLEGFELVSQTSKSGTRRYRLIKQAA